MTHQLSTLVAVERENTSALLAVEHPCIDMTTERPTPTQMSPSSNIMPNHSSVVTTRSNAPSQPPLALTCSSCHKLFAFVTEPLKANESDETKRITLDGGSIAVSAGYCHVCATVKRRSASGSWAPDLLLVYKADGVDILILKSNEVNEEGVPYESRAVEFLTSTAGAAE